MDNKLQIRDHAYTAMLAARLAQDNDPDNVRIVSVSTSPPHTFIPPIYADRSARAIAERIRNVRS